MWLQCRTATLVMFPPPSLAVLSDCKSARWRAHMLHFLCLHQASFSNDMLMASTYLRTLAAIWIWLSPVSRPHNHAQAMSKLSFRHSHLDAHIVSLSWVPSTPNLAEYECLT